MCDNIRRLLWLFLFSLACQAQQADLTTVSLSAERLHSAYAVKDISAVDALWSEHSPQRAAAHTATQKLFADPAISAIRETTVRDPELAGDHVLLVIERETMTASGETRQRLVTEWVREQNEWKIWKEGSPAELAQALIDEGTTLRNRGNPQQALSLLAVASRLAEPSGDAGLQSLILNNTGLVYYDLGDYTLAADSYRAAIALSNAHQDDAGASRALGNLSAVYSIIGDLAQASECLEKSLAIGQKLHDNRLISNAYGNMAINHARQGDYVHALALFQKTRDLLQSGSDKRALAGNLNNIGNVYLWQGDLDQAQDHFQKELSLATEAGLKPLVAVAWMGLGRVAEFRGDLRAAIGNYEKSLAVLNETGNKPFAASDLTYIGSAYSFLGDYKKSVEYFQKGLEIQRSIGAASEGVLTMGRIAEAYNRGGDFAKAADVAAEGRRLAEAAGLREALWRADLQAGRAAQGAGDNAKAETRYRDAIATIEALRQGVAGTESEQESSFEDKVEPYSRMAGLLADTGRGAEAFEFAERAKARVLLDVFQNGRAELPALMTAEERQKDRTLRMRLASLSAQLARARRTNAAAQVLQFTAELKNARLEYDGFENELAARHPRWKEHDGTVEPLGLDGAVATLAGPTAAFVEFVVTDDKVYGFAATGGSTKLRSFTVPISRAKLTEQVRQLQQRLAARNLGFRSSATALYDLLIAPAAVDLAHTRHLVIVPDGILWELPFQALMTPQGRYVLDDCAVSYAPSITALKAMIEVKRQRKSSPASTQLLAMGDPIAERDLGSRVKALYRDQTFEDLPMAKTEVLSLEPIYGKQSHIYVGADARESRFKAEAGSARVLHLATHAVLNDASPLYSYLLLAAEPAGGEDGLLEAREILGMNLNAELAVLSACETARGRVGAGEGVIGLSWALLVSGVPSTVLSQWKVASESTSVFMTAFHQNRKKPMSNAEALRAAALSLRKNPAYQHPFYWAAFTLIGAGLD